MADVCRSGVPQVKLGTVPLSLSIAHTPASTTVPSVSTGPMTRGKFINKKLAWSQYIILKF